MPLFKKKSKQAASESAMHDKPSLAIALGAQKAARGPKMGSSVASKPVGNEEGLKASEERKAVSHACATHGMEDCEMCGEAFADGGLVEEHKAVHADEKPGSMSAMIMRNRKAKAFADGGMVGDDSMELTNDYDDLNEEAAKKELYDTDQLSKQPLTSEGDDLSDEDIIGRSMISAIRSRMKKRM